MAKRFIFVTNSLRGNFITVDNNEEHSYSPVSLYLGIGRGNTIEEAWGYMIERHGLADTLPHITNVFGYEVNGESKDMNPDLLKASSIYTKKTASANSASDAQLGQKVCEWCNERLSNNGAAQFSHLKKHLRQLVKMKLLSDDQVSKITSVKLEPEIYKVFELGKTQKAF